uniref:Uncharacterized protein n=1 Tax=Myoviridae sp. ctCop38 TaxID=2826632 RepID=A0A8S5MY96_9CAUD|nr:MAG TPA: hypothetical protein [Myoviridae sp. ctCop38]
MQRRRSKTGHNTVNALCVSGIFCVAHNIQRCHRFRENLKITTSHLSILLFRPMRAITTVTHRIIIIREQRQAICRYKRQHIDTHAFRLRDNVSMDDELFLKLRVITLQHNVVTHILQVLDGQLFIRSHNSVPQIIQLTDCALPGVLDNAGLNHQPENFVIQQITLAHFGRRITCKHRRPCQFVRRRRVYYRIDLTACHFSRRWTDNLANGCSRRLKIQLSAYTNDTAQNIQLCRTSIVHLKRHNHIIYAFVDFQTIAKQLLCHRHKAWAVAIFTRNQALIIIKILHHSSVTSMFAYAGLGISLKPISISCAAMDDLLKPSLSSLMPKIGFVSDGLQSVMILLSTDADTSLPIVSAAR